jgi:hypothetical protein
LPHPTLAAKSLVMPTQEFYIRTASETEAHGPFTQEQLISLAEAGKVDPQTLYYEATTEQWVSIGANDELKSAVFPEKKRLTVKPKERVATLNEGPETNPPITVNDMLAAAEGRTSETKSKRDRTEDMERAAKFGRYACSLLLAISAFSLLLPSITLISTMDPAMWVSPFVYFGLVDLMLMIVVLLGVVSVYPFIRFRAALGFGFIGFIFFTQGAPYWPVAVLGAAYFGLYLTTVFVNYVALGLAVGLGMAGMGFLAYYLVAT